MIVLIIFELFILYLFFKIKEHFIVYIPLFTLIVDILPIFINQFKLAEENFYVVVLSYFRIFIFLLIFLRIIYKFGIKTDFNFIYLFLVFLLVKPFFTVDPYSSFKTSVSVVSFLTVFLSAYIYFRKFRDINRLIIVLRYTMLVYLINAAVFTILRIGDQPYGENIIYLGSVPLFSTYGIMYSMLFLFGNLGKLKKIDLFLIPANIMILILLSKRTPLILLIIGIIIIIIFNRKYYLKKRYFGFTVIFLIIGSLVFFYSLEKAKTNRDRVTEMKVTEEGRYFEYIILYQDILQTPNVAETLFGKDLFVEAGRFGLHQNIMDVVSDQRRLHSDYAILLFGSGLFGIVLYITFLFRILYKSLKLTQLRVYDKSLNSILLSVLICLFLNGFADSLTVATARSTPYLYLGCLLGILSNFSIRRKYETNTY